MKNDNLSIFKKIKISSKPVDMNSNIYAREGLVKQYKNLLFGKRNKRFNKFNTGTQRGILLANAAKWIGLAFLKQSNMVDIEDRHIANLFDTTLRKKQQYSKKKQYFDNKFFDKVHYFNLKKNIEDPKFKKQLSKYYNIKFNPVNYYHRQKIDRYNPSKPKDNCSTSIEHDTIRQINDVAVKRMFKNKKEIKSRFRETILDKKQRLKEKQNSLFNKNSKTRNQINNTTISNFNQQFSRSNIMM